MQSNRKTFYIRTLLIVLGIVALCVVYLQAMVNDVYRTHGLGGTIQENRDGIINRRRDGTIESVRDR
jgi:hypothetical protein